MQYEFHGHTITVDGIKEAYSHLDPEMEFRDTHWNIQPGDVVIDAGASYGSYTIRAAACGGIVYAFEPRPGDCDIIRRIALANGLTDRVKVYAMALWDAEGEATMNMAPTMSLVSGRFKQTVPITTIDAFTAKENLHRLDWVKIDTEGAELKVLAGARETLRRFRPTVIVECHLLIDPNMDKLVTRIFNEIPGYKTKAYDRAPCILTVSKSGAGE